jgi:outer membrane protein assembly factor BamB
MLLSLCIWSDVSGPSAGNPRFVAAMGARPRTLFGLDIFAGRVAWSRPLEGWVSSWGESLLILQAPAGIEAVELASGAVRWSQPFQASGILKGGHSRILAYDRQELRALDPSDGSTLWSCRFRITGRPRISGQDLIVTRKGGLARLSLETGKVIWEADDLAPNEVPMIRLAGPLLLVQGTALRCYRLSDGAKLWETDKSLLGPIQGDRLWAVTDEDLTCLDIRSGKAHWTRRLSEPLDLGANRERLAVFTDEQLLVLDPHTGATQWKREIQEDDLDEWGIHQGAIALKQEETLKVLDLRDGAELWEASSEDLVEDGRLGFLRLSEDMNLTSVDFKSGRPRWTVALAHRIQHAVPVKSALALFSERSIHVLGEANGKPICTIRLASPVLWQGIVGSGLGNDEREIDR